MGMTIAEKIIAAAAGVDSVKPGDIHTVKLDRLMSNDGTTHLTVDMYNNKLKNPHIADTSKLVFIVDHNVPSDSPKTAASQKKMRDFAKEHNIDFWEGKGVCHQVMIENYVRPGELIFGADSHTCSYGALGAFGTGVGCTDFLYGMVTGTSWVLVPESVKFNLTGKLPEGVYARDLILTIIGEIGANGCNYQAMEFTGEGAKTLSISDRMALCNMAVEAGAKTGIFEADEKAIEYLKEHGREPKAVYHSDPDAVYAREYTFDLSKVRPVVAKPDFVDNVVPAEEACGMEINEAFLGSCNNGRIEDLRVGAEIIKGKKVAEGVRFLVVPASQTIYRQALKEGLIDTFMEAGAIVMNPNCSVCWGSCQGVIGENEVLISTGTRNFKGRAGNPTADIYLVSPESAAATAIMGTFATAEDVMGEDVKELAKVHEPEEYLIDDSMIIKPLPLEEAKEVEIVKGPNIKFLPIPEKPQQNFCVPVSLKGGDNISTDDITPASAEFSSMRSNIPLMSQYCYHRYAPDFAARAKEMGRSVIIGGENYGQGSSREHAAINPMYLGVKAVIAKSIARIHKGNLVNHGIIPMLFADPADYDRIDQEDEIEFENLLDQIPTRKVTVKDKTKDFSFEVTLDLSDNEVEVVLSGGQLSYLKEQLEKEETK